MSLRKRITLTICSIIVLIMVLLSSIIYTKSAKILNQEEEKYMLSQLDRAQENIELRLEINQLETVTLARDGEVMDFLMGKTTTGALNKYLINLMREKNKSGNYYKDLFIINNEGTIIATCMPEAVDLDLSSREYFLESKRDLKTVTSDILIARSDSSLIVNTVTPIINTDGEVLGYGGIAMKADYFSNIVADLKLGTTGYYSIVDSNNRILVHRNRELISGRSPFDLTDSILQGGMVGSSIKRRIEGTEGQRELHIYKLMNSKDWVLIAVLPEKEVFEKSSKLLFYVLLTGFFGIWLAIMIGVYVSERISEPIVAITKYINKAVNSNKVIEESISNSIKELSVSDEKLDDGIDAEEADEIGNLRKAFINLKDYFAWLTKREEIGNAPIMAYSKDLGDRLEDRSNRIANFISTLSHDLKTSITLIKGYSKGLKVGVIEEEATRQVFLDGIYRSAVDIERITCDILDNAYEAKCCPKLNRERVLATGFISQLYESTKQYIISSGRGFAGEWYLSEEVYLYVDRIKIKRAWNNLISNAIKYSDEGALITINITLNDDRLEFRVDDTGKGIAEEELDSIFEMFYKGENNKKGYGLGLFIAQSVIESHESKLYVNSTLGRGTSFWFNLKVNKLESFS